MKSRRWFRFTLRTFFVLWTLCGVWLGLQVKWISDRHEAATCRDEIGGSRFYRYQGNAKAPWSIRLLGEPGYQMVDVFVRDSENLTTHEERILSRLDSLFPESRVGHTDSSYRRTDYRNLVTFP